MRGGNLYKQDFIVKDFADVSEYDISLIFSENALFTRKVNLSKLKVSDRPFISHDVEGE